MKGRNVYRVALIVDLEVEVGKGGRRAAEKLARETLTDRPAELLYGASHTEGTYSVKRVGVRKP